MFPFSASEKKKKKKKDKNNEKTEERETKTRKQKIKINQRNTSKNTPGLVVVVVQLTTKNTDDSRDYLQDCVFCPENQLVVRRTG